MLERRSCCLPSDYPRLPSYQSVHAPATEALRHGRPCKPTLQQWPVGAAILSACLGCACSARAQISWRKEARMLRKVTQPPGEGEKGRPRQYAQFVPLRRPLQRESLHQNVKLHRKTNRNGVSRRHRWIDDIGFASLPPLRVIFLCPLCSMLSTELEESKKPV